MKPQQPNSAQANLARIRERLNAQDGPLFGGALGSIAPAEPFAQARALGVTLDPVELATIANAAKHIAQTGILSLGAAYDLLGDVLSNAQPLELLSLGEPLPQVSGWARTGKGKFHRYDSGESACNYQRAAGVLTFSEDAQPDLANCCSSCALAVKKRNQAAKGQPYHERRNRAAQSGAVALPLTRPERVAAVVRGIGSGRSAASDTQLLIDSSPT